MIKTKILIFLLSLSSLFTQRLTADVKLSAVRFTEIQKEEISELPSLIRDYISEYDWINSENDDEIKCNISLIFESVVENSGLKQYTAQFIINSAAQEYFYDKKFAFVYKQGEPIKRFSSESRPIGNFLDFYVNMVLAGEMDTYSLYGGDEFYDRAQEALTVGRNSEQSGWDSREKIFKNYTSPLVRSLRKAKLLYYSALNYKENQDYKEMRKETENLINEVKHAYANEPSNLMLKRFFEGYHKRIIEVLDPALDQRLILLLLQMDPVRKDFYQKYTEHEN